MNTASRPPRPLLPLALILGAGGVGAMLVGWVKVSASAHVDRQVSWSALSLIGAVLVCAAAGLVATSGERVFLLHVQRLAAAGTVNVDGRAAAPAGAGAGRGGGRLVAAPSMARYHRSECPLATGKAVVADSRTGHERAGRRPCGVCGA
jgi:hypothetical protein